jgi:hypothetical protein
LARRQQAAADGAPGEVLRDPLVVKSVIGG